MNTYNQLDQVLTEYNTQQEKEEYAYTTVTDF